MFSQILLLFIINILSAIGYSLIAPLYPPVALTKRVPEYVIGFIFSCFAISNVITIPLTPKFVKQYGRKRVFYWAILAEV
jgi:MFS family permease